MKKSITEQIDMFLTEAKPVKPMVIVYFEAHGFEEYSHGHNEIGFFNKNSKLQVKEMLRVLKKWYPKAEVGRNKWDGTPIWGDKDSVWTTWMLEFSPGPYREFVITVQSKDGRTVNNVTFDDRLDRT